MVNKKNGESFYNLQLSSEEQLYLLNSIMESSTGYSIFATNLEGNIVAWNVGAHHLYGYDNSKIIGKSVNILHDPEDIRSGKARAILDKVLQTGKWSGALRRVRKDGSLFNVFVTVTLRKDRNNIPIGFTFISRDLTELENVLDLINKLKVSEARLKDKNMDLLKKTRQLQESDRQKNEFLANASHELRTPLNGIIGFAELMYDGTIDSSSPKYKEFVADILSSANHLLALINELLDLAKIEAGKMDFHPIKTDLKKIIMEIQDIFHLVIIEKNIQFEIDIDPTLKDIITDPDRLRQIINNYVSNALKFTPMGGRVTIRACIKDKKNICIEVQDTGIGIRGDDLNKLFTKFQQLNTGSNKQYPGTGLGLALVKHLVEAQGGRVEVKSTYGEGSTFYAILPCFPYHQTFVKYDDAKDKLLSDKETYPAILVIEPESLERQIMVDTLIQAGYAVITAADIATALRYNEKNQFDAIILDSLLPEMVDWKIIHTLRSSKSLQKISPIIITAAFEQPISSEIHDFLVKPVDREALLSVLERNAIYINSGKSILIIDGDAHTLTNANHMLTECGFRVVCKNNKVSALIALEQERPDIVLFDPFTPGMDGFEFLRYYHQTERGVLTPVIIWTQKKLTAEEYVRLKNPIQRLILKGEDLKENVLDEFE